MKSGWKVLSGILALVLVGLGFVWSLPAPNLEVTAASRAAGGAPIGLGTENTVPVTVTVSGPYTPTLSVAVRDLPADPELPILRREPVQRDARGIIVPDIQMPPHGNVLAELQQSVPKRTDGIGIVASFPGAPGYIDPPDTTGDVGLNHVLQGVNSVASTSQVFVWSKDGTQMASFYMDDLATTSPCNSGYCDPIVQYDELADRWLITEFDDSIQTLCVYVSKTPDPLGQWWAYAFNPTTSGTQDYPKYAVWPDGYYIAANNGGTVIVLERADMLNGQPATMQEFNIGELPGFSFQLTMPATLEGAAPPSGEPAFYLRPRDTEIHGGTCPSCDLMEMWALHVDWVTPSNSNLTALPGIQLTDWDQTLCGSGSDWSCMSQPGTSQKLDPIREPLHYPLQYRNFGTHEVLVGCFAEDVDGLDRAAVHWFEIRRTPPGSGSWVRYQEGVVGDGVGDIHRSVCSAAMDSAGNIAVGYTRTGANTPYYPSIYYSARLSTDPLGTMPIYDQMIWNGTSSHTSSERWGDYSGIGVDPADGCTFWYTSEFGGSAQSRVAGLRFDECGTPDFTIAADPDALSVCAPEVATSTIMIGQVVTYSYPVVLAALDVPAGTSATFVPPTVTPPGESVLTLDVGSGTADGDYMLVISGTAEGTNVHTTQIALQVRSAPPGAPTLLTPPNGAIDLPTAGILFEWNAVTGATSYRLQVDDDPAFGSPAADISGIAGPQYTLATALEPATLYYWRVQAENACGSGSFSGAFYFFTRDLCILLVDDDNDAPDTAPYFTAALDTLGYGYDLFDTNGGSGPTAAQLAGYPIVVWFSGDAYGGTAGPNGTDETNLATYLDGGGKLFLSSQDYLYDQDLTPFGQTYLGIASYTNDSGNATTKYGVSGDPIGGGLGPYALTYPSGFSDYGDIVNAGSGASVAFRSASSGGNGLDLDKDGGDWQTVFFGTDWVPIYNNNAANGRQVLDRILTWFGGCASCEAPADAAFTWTPLDPVAGEVITFTASASGTAPFLFQWAFGDGGTGVGSPTGYAYAAAGDYTVTLTATNACGYDQASALISVAEPPCGPVQIVTVTTAISGCQVTFGSDFAGTPPYTWEWDFGAWGTSTETNPLVDFGASGTYPYTLTAANDCGADLWAAEVTVECAVCDPVEIVTVTTDIAGCEVTFGTDFAGTAPYTWEWDFGAFGTSTATNPLVDFGASGTYPYTLTAANDCGADLWAAEVTVECAVCDPVEIVTVTTDIAGCEVTFGTAFTGTAPYTWEWDFGAWGTSTATNPLVDFGASGTYPYTLTAANGCGEDLWAAEVTVECAVCDPVEIVTVTTDIAGCEVTFGTAFTGTAPYIWAWDFGALGTSTATNPLVDFGASGTYPYTLTAENDCGEDLWTDTVTVDCAPPTVWKIYLPLVSR